MSQHGYTDTPMLPGLPWRVHDPERPQPVAVDPGTTGTPPSDAVVLFDGASLDAWVRTGGGEVGWLVENGYLQVTRTGNIQTREHFGDCQVHVEWAAPAQVAGDSQGRGNSGVFLMGVFEIQVLDCYQNPTYADGTTASIYGQFPPLVNACRKPGEWQSFDAIFLAPRFEDDRLIRPAYLTLLHNGIAVHVHRELLGRTGHRNVLGYSPQPAEGPIMLQDHGDPVRYRNLWVRRLTLD